MSAALSFRAQLAVAGTAAAKVTATPTSKSLLALSFISLLPHEAGAVPSESHFVIRTFSGETEAYIAQAALEANGIESMLLRDDAGGMMPWLQWLHPIRLVVSEDDSVEALEILDTPPLPEENRNP